MQMRKEIIMVKLSLADFADATSRMIQLSGLQQTRLTVKLRPSDKKIVLKSTDQKSTLTSSATDQKDLKIVEQIIADYVTRCTKDAPQDRSDGSDAKKSSAGGPKGGKKGAAKGGKGK